MAFNQKKYIKEYNKNTYKMYPFRVRTDSTTIINKLSSVSSLNGYILSLIENDIDSGILTIKQIKRQIIPVLAKYGIQEIYLFGSYARGEATKESDIDIYCDSGNVKSFIEQGFLEDELQKATGKDIDIVFIGSQMDSYFRQQLEGDKIRLC